MLSFLDMINHSLGYFNVNLKLKKSVIHDCWFCG
ncbi:DUF6681 family protein [Paucilactobacillus hokkaidonensis]